MHCITMAHALHLSRGMKTTTALTHFASRARSAEIRAIRAEYDLDCVAECQAALEHAKALRLGQAVYEAIEYRMARAHKGHGCQAELGAKL